MGAHAWRVLYDSPASPAAQMARDEALFESVACGVAPPTLRIYEWNVPAITLGRFQKIERALCLSACDALGIEMTRRITGGKAILHGFDLTFGVVAPLSAFGFSENEPAPIVEVYRRASAPFREAFSACGLAATMGTCVRPSTAASAGDCFAAASQADVVSQNSGQKLMGGALCLRRGEGGRQTVLLQISLPLEQSEFLEKRDALARRVFGVASSVESVYLGAHLRRVFLDALVRSIEVRVGNGFTESAEQAWERDRAEFWERQRYRQQIWIRKGEYPAQESD